MKRRASGPRGGQGISLPPFQAERPSAQLHRAATLAVPAGASFTEVPLDTVDWDQASAWQPDRSRTTLVVSARPGLYLVEGTVEWEDAGTGQRKLQLALVRPDGTTTVLDEAASGTAASGQVAQRVGRRWTFAVGEGVRLQVSQQTAATRNLVSATLHLEYIGGAAPAAAGLRR